ncbi:11452_t:CDS:1, partial [Rhizophagus irregularis]
RTCFDSHSAITEQKEAFTASVSFLLPDMFSSPPTLTLNQIWHKFKTALLAAARSHFSRKTISLMKPKTIPHELQPYVYLSHSLDYFTMSLKKLSSITRLTVLWSQFFNNFEPIFNKLFPNHSGLLNGLSHPSQLLTVFDSSNLSYNEFLIQF